MAGIVRLTYDASAGSRRGSMATTTASAATSPAGVRTAATRPPLTTRSSASVSVCTTTPRVARRSAIAVPSVASPPGTVQEPKRCWR